MTATVIEKGRGHISRGAQEINAPVPPNLPAFAAEMVETCNGNLQEAEKQLAYRLRKDRAKWFEALVAYAAPELIRGVKRKLRNIPEPREDRGKDSLAGRFNAAAEKYANWPLADGTPLIRATKAQLLSEAAFHQRQGKTMFARAVWFTSIALEMGEAAVVGDALDAVALQALHEKAHAEEGAP